MPKVLLCTSKWATARFRKEMRNSKKVLSKKTKQRCELCGNPLPDECAKDSGICPSCSRFYKQWKRKHEDESAGGSAGGSGAGGSAGGSAADAAESGERCPICGKLIVGEGGMPGAPCISCWRKEKDESLKRKRDEDEGGGAGMV
jgi:hypothetical protein